MSQTQIILLVSTAPAVAELVIRALLGNPVTTVVLEARSGAEAIDVVRAQPLRLVVLDLDLESFVSAQSLCVKLRALRPTLPILPMSTSVDMAPLLADLGCAPTLSKSLLVANPSQLRVHVQDALQQEPQLKVPKGTFTYLLEQADAALREERRLGQIEVLVLCRNVLLRCGLVHSLASLGMSAHIVAADTSVVPGSSGVPPGARLVIGPLSDLEALQAVAQAARLPLLLVALHAREFELTPYSTLAGASVLLFNEAGDIRQFLVALQTVASGTPFLAVPAGVIARWAAPIASLTAREWEVIVALLLTADPEVVAQMSRLSVPSVETYTKRVRRKLGSRSLSATLAIVQAHVTGQLGVAPTAPQSVAQPVRTVR